MGCHDRLLPLHAFEVCFELGGVLFQCLPPAQVPDEPYIPGLYACIIRSSSSGLSSRGAWPLGSYDGRGRQQYPTITRLIDPIHRV